MVNNAHNNTLKNKGEKMNYWEECIKEAFEDSGIKATDEQIQNVVSWVDGAHENYGLATGEDIANANYISDEAAELKSMKAAQEKRRIWESETRPCRSCTTTGITRDGWGRDRTCYNCDGSGRVRGA